MQSRYRDSRAMWRALTDRAKIEARARGLEPGALVRAFVADRFLARVFTLFSYQWVLKGGNAVLTRAQDARATKDLDLLAELEDLDEAVGQLRAAAALDLGDHFRFRVGPVKKLQGGQQAVLTGNKVSIDAYSGRTHRQRFGMDVVTGSLMTTEPDILPRPSLLPAIPGPKVRLYPAVDHIADKVAATQSKYGAGRDQPSSRVRDLVDLVVFAKTQTINGRGLQTAIAAEWVHRGMPGRPHFEPPSHWESLYPAMAAKVSACDGFTRYSDAMGLVHRFLAPALDGTATGHQWTPEISIWVESPPAP